jgi:hypothetical protein
MTFEEMREVVSRVTYRPGWRLSLELDRFEGPVLVVEATEPDSSDARKTIDLRIITFIPPVDDEHAFMEWLLYRFCRIETHEAREWLRLDDERWVNPHTERV